MENNAGFIYRNEKGEFLLRIINRGHFDEDHYILKFVTVFEWGCLLYSEIALDENNRDSLTRIKYRTLFSKEVIADCVCENVVVSGDAYNGFELEVVMTQGFEMKNTHDLKTDTKVFQDVLDGNKTFEIRFNDRDFQVGDSVLLKETKFTGEQIESGQPLIFTGREIHKRISYLLSGYGLQDGWVILGIADEAGQQSQQAKIDELQAMVDEALKILKDWDDQSYRDDAEQLIGEIEDILKGNKDD